MIIFILAIFVKVEVDSNPSVRLLLSVVSFSEKTLSSQNYLAYDINLENLFSDYTNSDIKYSGNAYVKKVKGFPYSLSGSISGERSLAQKKFSCESNMNVLVLNVGELDFYAEDQTIYVVAPMLGDLSYGFDTGLDLFKKGPSFTQDLTKEWFHENKGNIINFINSIDIQKTGDTYTDDDNITSEEYAITIPQGQGDFIWDLLGMNAPDHDINASVFLDKHCQIRKVIFDLSYKTEGAYLTVSGENCNTMELYVPLPDDEVFIWTLTRNGNIKYTNAFTNNMTYNTEDGTVYTIDFDLTMNFVDSGISAEAQNITVKENSTVLLEGYCNASIENVSDMRDVFEDIDTDLDSVTVIDWAQIRNDTASFIDDVIDKARENTDIFNLF